MCVYVCVCVLRAYTSVCVQRAYTSVCVQGVYTLCEYECEVCVYWYVCVYNDVLYAYTVVVCVKTKEGVV